MTEQSNQTATYQPPQPDAAVKSLAKLVGTWTLSEDTSGTVTYEWMEGGFFLLQHVDMVHEGHHIKGLEIIGRLQPFGEEPSRDIYSRYYGSTGETLDYVYELSGDTLMIWGGEKGSPAFYKGTFSEDGNVCAGAWEYPGGGGYRSTMTRV